MPRKFEKDIALVASSFLAYVRRQEGTWVPGMDALRAATNECRRVEWVHYTQTHPKARSAVTAVIERLRRDEFRDIEKKKCGTHKSGRVFFRLREPGNSS